MPIELPSPNHGPRPSGTAVDMLILHYTGMQSCEEALARLTDPAAQVSAHYVIGEDGTVWRLVPEARRAWHAGVSCWQGERDVNGRSIGIELVNPGHEWGYRPFPAIQMAALGDLALSIMGRHGIAPERVLGHSDVAPSRKDDPGELFDWQGLARIGVGLWVDAPEPCPGTPDCEEMLARYGYETDGPGGVRAALTAFQRHFAPAFLGRDWDAAQAGILHALLDRTGR
jgi:N-acetylmuramoyl-L-alanine amidase